jgi:uncharacterized protein YbaP (TraB family)
MKNVIKSTIAVVLFIFSGTIHAQKKAPKLENSLLWEVSGNGLSKPSYLYGTIHMICGSDYFLSDKTKKAFEASEKLVLEIDMSDPKEMTEMIDSLKESGTEETAKLVSQYKQENITGIYDAFSENKYMSKKTKEIILDNRNENWIKQLQGLMQNESLFIAVGSAHLAGESGVINLLKKAGYKVKPVMN